MRQLYYIDTVGFQKLCFMKKIVFLFLFVILCSFLTRTNLQAQERKGKPPHGELKGPLGGVQNTKAIGCSVKAI